MERGGGGVAGFCCERKDRMERGGGGVVCCERKAERFLL